MNWIQILAGPLIGAAIGYCTNYIAVKMLFRPLKPVKFGDFTLPFTPGVIPRRKSQLAKVAGAAVEQSLLGKEDLKKVLLDEEMKHTVACGIADAAAEGFDSSVRELAEQFAGEEEYEEKKEELTGFLTEKITEGLLKIDVGGIVSEEGAAAVRKRVEGTMLAMFVKNETISQIAGMIGEKVTDYIQESGQEKIENLVAQELDALEKRNVRELALDFGIDRNVVCSLAEKIYEKAIGNSADTIAEKFHIAEIVEKKIDSMSEEELETLVLSVMKHELGMVVNLGAVIGFVLGFLNVIF